MKKIIDFLANMKVAVFTFIILLVVSAVGAFIPQGLDAGMYHARYPGWLAALILAFQLDTVYESWYFMVLLAFLTVSLFTCLVKRLKNVIAPYHLPDAVKPEDLKGWRLVKEYDGTIPAEAAAEALSRAGYRAAVVGGAVVADRRRWSRFGEFFVHVGVLVIILGGALRWAGYEEKVHLFEGYRFSLSEELSSAAVVECLDVEAARDPNTGAITDYKTSLRVSEPGFKPAEKVIEVNDALRYRNLAFYQTDMNDSGETGLSFVSTKLPEGKTAAEVTTVGLTWRLLGETGTVTGVPGSAHELGKTGYSLQIMDYFANFVVTEKGITDDNPEPNPTVIWMLTKGNDRAARGFSFYDDPAFDIYRFDDPALAGTEFSMNLTTIPQAPAGREKYLLASGSYVPMGASRIHVFLKPDPTNNPDLRARVLTLEDTATGSALDVGFGERKTWDLPDGTYEVRFLGSDVAPYSGVTVSRDPGLGIFYAGAILFSLGVIVALYLRHERVYVVSEKGKTTVAGRSNKGNDMFAEKFERLAEALSDKLGIGPEKEKK